jgi:hypothetical protein
LVVPDQQRRHRLFQQQVTPPAVAAVVAVVAAVAVAGGGEVGKGTGQQSYHGFRQYFVQPLSDIVVFIVVGHRVPRLPKAGKD